MALYTKMDQTTRTAVILTSLLSCLVVNYVEGAMLWFEQMPSFDDPCTTVVISESRAEWKTIHPPAKCLQGGVIWLGTFGRVRVWLKFGTDKKKVQEFEFCLTAGSPNRIYIWWDSRRESWSPISFPLKIAELPKRDMCKTSENGTMDLYLEPPWAFPQIMSYFSYNVTLLEDTPEGEGAKVEQPEQREEPEQPDDGWSFF